MKAAVRYYSRGGNVKAMAEAFARGAGVEALSIDDPRAAIDAPVDVLFVGGALYAYRLDQSLVDYLDGIPEGLVGRAVCFGSSYLTRRPVYLIQERLKAKGITIVPQAVYARNRPKQSLLDACEFFASTEIDRDTSLDGLSPYERVRAMRIAVGDADLDEELDKLADCDAGEASHDESDASETATNDADAQGELRDSSDDGSPEDASTGAASQSANTNEDKLLIDVDGINGAFKEKVIEIVEGIPNVNLKLVELPDTLPSSLVFACSSNHDVDDVVPLVKGTLKVSELGSIMLFRVTPHGEVMWVPKRS